MRSNEEPNIVSNHWPSNHLTVWSKVQHTGHYTIAPLHIDHYVTTLILILQLKNLLSIDIWSQISYHHLSIKEALHYFFFISYTLQWLSTFFLPQLISLISDAASCAPCTRLRDQFANSLGVSTLNMCASTPFFVPVRVPNVKSSFWIWLLPCPECTSLYTMNKEKTFCSYQHKAVA